jgi:hypothetical protein
LVTEKRAPHFLRVKSGVEHPSTRVGVSGVTCLVKGLYRHEMVRGGLGPLGKNRHEMVPRRKIRGGRGGQGN